MVGEHLYGANDTSSALNFSCSLGTSCREHLRLTRKFLFASRNTVHICTLVQPLCIFYPMAAALRIPQDLQLLQAPTTSAPCHETLGYLAYRLHVTSFRPDSTWYDHEYYPRPRMQGMRHKIRTTRKVAVQNHAEKKPHSIPNEVLLPVNKDLGGLDFRNLQSTCRKKGIKLPSIMGGGLH
jgi:hypothetical protein